MTNDERLDLAMRSLLSRGRHRRKSTHLDVSDTPKMIKETLCTVQALLGNSAWVGEDRRQDHMDRLSRLINECDRHRPIGTAGKHGDKHTATCGCDGHEVIGRLEFYPISGSNSG